MVKSKLKKDNKEYFIYIIECEGKRLYTGITTNYKRRFLEHADSNCDKDKGKLKARKGAKFTRAFKPEKIVLLYKTDIKKGTLKSNILKSGTSRSSALKNSAPKSKTPKSLALKLEYYIKALNKENKLLLISDNKYFRIFFKDILDTKLYKRLNIYGKP